MKNNKFSKRFILILLAAAVLCCFSLAMVYAKPQPLAQKPPAVSTFKVVAAGSSRVTLSWVTVAGATSYTIKYGTQSGTYPNSVNVGNVPTYTIKNLTNGTKYYFIIVAVNSAGESNPSAQVSATPVSTSFARSFPETTSKTRVLTDQLSTNMTQTQMEFYANHMVGCQKMPVSFTRQIRAINPNFIMLHYHLAFWQSYVNYIIDGTNWGNDLNITTTHEDWFMHRFDAQGPKIQTQYRVQAFDDYKYLMNISNSGYKNYLLSSLVQQVRDGEYDGVFLDSYGTATLNYYLQNYPEYTGTSAVTGTYPELGTSVSWKTASQSFMTSLTADLNAYGIYSLPNVDNFSTTWDTTDYTTANGGMTEGAFTYYSLADWKQGLNGHLKLINKDQVNICQDYKGRWDFDKRLYYLGNYLLIRGKYTYINYFETNNLEYYPETDLDLGAPLESAGTNIDNLDSNGDLLYVRRFEKGIVLVSPRYGNTVNYQIPTDGTYRKVVLGNSDPQGYNTVASDGTYTNYIQLIPASGTITVTPWTAVILMKD